MTQKFVWIETFGLMDEPKHAGCTMSASALGRRIDLARQTVERVRSELLHLELLGRRDLGAGRVAEWFAVLPKSCRPKVLRLTDDEIAPYAEELDRHIASLGTSIGSEGGPNAPQGSDGAPPSLPK